MATQSRLSFVLVYGCSTHFLWLCQLVVTLSQSWQFWYCPLSFCLLAKDAPAYCLVLWLTDYQSTWKFILWLMLWLYICTSMNITPQIIQLKVRTRDPSGTAAWSAYGLHLQVCCLHWFLCHPFYLLPLSATSGELSCLIYVILHSRISPLL